MKKILLIIWCIAIAFSCNDNTKDELNDLNVSTPPDHLTLKQAKYLASIINMNDLSGNGETKSASSDEPREIGNIDYYISKNGDTLMYCVNYKNNKGYIVLSADNNRFPLLAHSSSGSFTFDVSELNPINAWLDGEENVVKQNLDNKDMNDDAWQHLAEPGYTYEITRVYDLPQVQTRARRTYSTGKNYVHPYTGMNLMWGQEAGYNYYAKLKGAKAGCPAVAVGMLMWDLSFRPDYKGTRNYSFQFPSWACPTVLTNLNEPNEIAILFRNIADVIPEYKWSLQESGASGNNIQAGLRAMGFPNATIKDYEFEEAYANLDQKKHGIMLVGTANDAKGHVWFCDGYQEMIFKVQKTMGGVVYETWYEYEDALYMNWGWDGRFNGWYEFSDFRDYTNHPGMFVNLDYVPVYNEFYPDYL